jgi:hypothetical protein
MAGTPSRSTFRSHELVQAEVTDIAVHDGASTSLREQLATAGR